MSTVKSIKELVNSNQGRVYVFLADKETETRFVTDALAEGYTFEEGTNLTEREFNNLYALNRNNTVNFINSIGRMAFQCNAGHIVRVDYKKFISGSEDYIYG